MQLVTSSTSANLPRGILASIGPAWEYQTDISQMERERFQYFGGVGPADLGHGRHGDGGVDGVHPDLLRSELQGSDLCYHVQSSLGGAVDSVVRQSSLGGLERTE